MFDEDDSGTGFLGFFCILLILPMLIGWYIKLTVLLLEFVCRALGLVIMGICYVAKFVFEIMSKAGRMIYNYILTISEQKEGM